MSDETVKLDITIEISTSGEVDTGITVADWNAMTYLERSKVVEELWDVEASSHDQGGVSVVTDGAVEA